MRAIILAALLAAGLGVVGVSNVSAAPANGIVLGDAANQNSNVSHVQHWRWGSGDRRWRRYHRWNRCHARRWSRWYRC
jgi:hypothetical protein